jgi:hypothetical protein
LSDTDPAKAYYWYGLTRDRLPPGLVGAQSDMLEQSDMLDWNIRKLSAALSSPTITLEDLEVEYFRPSPDGQHDRDGHLRCPSHQHPTPPFREW